MLILQVLNLLLHDDKYPTIVLFFLISLFDSRQCSENLSMDKLEVCSYFLIHSIYYKYRRYNGDQRFKIKKKKEKS